MKPKSAQERLKELREREQKILARAQEMATVILPEESHSQAEIHADPAEPSRPIVAKKIMDVYKRGIYFSFRSRSCVDKREQAIQTQADLFNRRTTLDRTGGLKGLIQKNIIDNKNKTLFADSENSASNMRESKLVQKLAMNFKPDNTSQKKVEARELENDERNKLVQSQKFGEYFSEASKFVEKILKTSTPIDGEDGNPRNQKTDKASEVEAELLISRPLMFKNSAVNHLAWSQMIPELFLTVHADRPEGNIYDRILLWNINFSHRPELELYSNTKVQRAVFSPHSTEIVVAGLENGRICLYDLRAKKDPVMRSAPSADSHKTPITGLEFIGGRNSSNIVSSSEEGRICVWPLNKFDTPKKLDLLIQTKKTEEEDIDFRTEPLCLATMPGDTSNVYIGCIDNNLYQCTVHSNTNFQNARPVLQTFSGHTSVVNALHINKSSNIASQLSGLILSGSLDWSIRLWNPRNSSQCLATFNHHQDPISDVNWNYAHPAMFASASAGGKVTVHNLLKDFDNPVATFNLNCCVLNAKWDTSGRVLAITDEVGNTHIKKFTSSFLGYKQQDVKVFDSSITQNK